MHDTERGLHDAERGLPWLRSWLRSWLWLRDLAAFLCQGLELGVSPACWVLAP